MQSSGQQALHECGITHLYIQAHCKLAAGLNRRLVAVTVVEDHQVAGGPQPLQPAAQLQVPG